MRRFLTYLAIRFLLRRLLAPCELKLLYQVIESLSQQQLPGSFKRQMVHDRLDAFSFKKTKRVTNLSIELILAGEEIKKEFSTTV